MSEKKSYPSRDGYKVESVALVVAKQQHQHDKNERLYCESIRHDGEV